MDVNTPVILEGQNLRKAFGGLVAVDNVNLKVQAGTLHSIIGPNGAGKTTLFNLLSRVYNPTHGRIFFKGHEITHTPTHRLARLGLGRSFQITSLFPSLTVLENVRLAAQALGHDNFRLLHAADSFKPYLRRAEEVIAQVGLQGKELALAQALAHGEKRKLELGLMLAGDPEVLLLDEPTAGMSSDQIPALLDIIQSIQKRDHKTIVLVEHRMDMVMRLSDKITVMHQGQLLAEGSPAEIAANATVQSAYLGALYGDLSQTARA